MANINIIETCNYRCKYCFAEEFTECGDNKIMDLNTFRTALEFVARTQDYVGIIGGEPTLHPQFSEILDEVIKNENIKRFLVFTNGTNLYRYIDRLANSKSGVLVNYNAPYEIIRQHGEEAGKKLFEKTRENVIKIRKLMGERISVGVNIFDDNTDWSHVVDILKATGIEDLRVSTVAPNAHNRDNFNLTYYDTYIKSLISLLDQVKDCVRKIVFDCSSPPACVLNKYKQELDNLNKYYENKGSKLNLYSCSSCKPVIDITPDLEIVRCFSMSRYKKINLSDFENVLQISEYFEKEIDGICYNVKTNFLCENCEFSKKKMCNGGCMSFALNKAKIIKNFIDGVC